MTVNSLSANPTSWSDTLRDNFSVFAEDLLECVWPFFVRLVIKGLRMSILTFFLTNSILMHCYYGFFSLYQMLLCIEIYVTLLFPNFKLVFVTSIAFYLQVMGFITHFKAVKDFTCLIYLSMPINNFTWQARVGIFNSSKPLLKTQIRNRGMLQCLFHHTVYSLYFSLLSF